MDFSVLLDFQQPFPMKQFSSAKYVSECLVVLSKKWFQGYILQSFSNLDELERQFRLDGSRSDLYLFEKKSNIQRILCYLLNTYPMPDPHMAFFTQGLFAPIFEWIVNSLPENVYLGECDPKPQPTRTLEMIGQNKKIRFHLRRDYLTITKWLRIFTFEIDKTGEEVVKNKFYIYFRFRIPLEESDDDIHLELELYPQQI